MIELSHVYKTYAGPVHALRDINLKIDKGEFIFLTGPSGAGKTTLFKLLSAFDKPTSGIVKVGPFKLNDMEDEQVPFYRRQIGVVYQDFKLIKDKTLFENVALPLMIKNERPDVIIKKVHDILCLVGLEHKYDQKPEYVSGGEQQRTAIARALVHQPSLLIADEPTGNLDPELSDGIIQLLEKVCAQGTTVIVATHDHAIVENRKKRRLILKEGQLINEGPDLHV